MLFSKQKMMSIALATVLGVSAVALPTVSNAKESVKAEQKVNTPLIDNSLNLVETLYVNNTRMIKLNEDTTYLYGISLPHDMKLGITGLVDNGRKPFHTKESLSSFKLKTKDDVLVAESIKTDFMGLQFDMLSKDVKKGEYVLEITTPKNEEFKLSDLNYLLTVTQDKGTNYNFDIDYITSLKGVLPQNVKTTIYTNNQKGSGIQVRADVKYQGESKFKQYKGYSLDKEFKFATNKIGKHTIKLTSLDSNGASTTKEFVINVVKAETPSRLTVKNLKKEYKQGQTIQGVYSSKGSFTEYKYELKNARGSKIAYKSYSESKKFSLKAPKLKGKYKLTVYAKQHNATKEVKVTKTITIK